VTERVVGKALGFRQWRIDGDRLASANTEAGQSWALGLNRAACRRREYHDAVSRWWPEMPVLPDRDPHAAPDPGCDCGLYAFHTPVEKWAATPVASVSGTALLLGTVEIAVEQDFVVGAVAAWGRLQVHETGFRAEYAEPVVLAYSPAWTYTNVLAVQRLAALHAIECVPVDELAEAASRYADPVPKSLRPVRPPIHQVDLWTVQKLSITSAQAHKASLSIRKAARASQETAKKAADTIAKNAARQQRRATVDAKRPGRPAAAGRPPKRIDPPKQAPRQRRLR
jgi:hypothetical protein